MIFYIENPKDSTKLLELINEFSKVARYRKSVQKSVSFLNTNNKLSERETKNIISFTVASKKNTPRNKFNQRSKSTVLGKL